MNGLKQMDDSTKVEFTFCMNALKGSLKSQVGVMNLVKAAHSIQQDLLSYRKGSTSNNSEQEDSNRIFDNFLRQREMLLYT